MTYIRRGWPGSWVRVIRNNRVISFRYCALVVFKEVATTAKRRCAIVTERIDSTATVKNLGLRLNVAEAVVVIVRLSTRHVVRVTVAGVQSKFERKWGQVIRADIKSAAGIQRDVNRPTSVKLILVAVVLVQF